MTGLDLAAVRLDAGGHEDRADGVCLMEAVAWFAGQAHTDHPPCVSPVLAGFGRRLNDALPGGVRQDLVPLIPLLPGTAGDGRDSARGYLALDWLIRSWLPAWLDLVPVTDGNSACRAGAEALRQLPPVTSPAAVTSAMPAIRQARQHAAAARDAAGDAAQDAAWYAAGDAAWDAARYAAGDAAWAAVAAAGDATWAAEAVAAAGAGDAAWAVLQPVVDGLQRSAITLYREMITVGEVP
jgi:hypothetical protein